MKTEDRTADIKGLLACLVPIVSRTVAFSLRFDSRLSADVSRELRE